MSPFLRKTDIVKIPTPKFLSPSLFMKTQKALKKAKKIERKAIKNKNQSVALLMAGCKDFEFSYDAIFNNRPNGAFTYIALNTLRKMSKNATYHDWFKEIRKHLPHRGYPQTPQLVGAYYQKIKWKIFEE